jgi:predicted TIM-barrel fold metal-dependent hydrolase
LDAIVKNIPLFDSLSHPTLTGDWFSRGVDASFESLVQNMRNSSFARACAVGIASHEGYEHVAFAKRCSAFPQLVPIAGVTPKSTVEIDNELDMVRDLGFRGIKLHPRLSKFSLEDPRLIDTFNSAARHELPVFLCTYFHTTAEFYPERDPLFALARILKNAPTTRLVLLHGGTIELMRWMQFVRHMPNVLFDISFTLMRYRGASLDADLAWLFNGFYNRTCIGTDHPEWSHVDVRRRFEELATGASLDAAGKIGSLNLARFLGVDAQ